jgi:LuxR family maltose regulon positive regulatory protein
VGSGPIGDELAAHADHADLLRSGIEAANRWPGSVLVGIDDAHLVSMELLERSEALLEGYLKAEGLFAATSRLRPELPVARGRVEGWLREIGDLDLAFTDDELFDLAGVVAGSPDRAVLMRLRAETAGWATAAVLAGRWVRRQTASPGSLIDDLATHLADQVLDDLDPLERRALLIAASLPSSSVGLLEAVAGSAAARSFALLRARHPGLVHRADDAAWSTVHPLLAQGLRPRVDLASGPRTVDILRRAASWHRAQGDLIEPIELLLVAGRWSEATDLLVQSAMRFAEEARHQKFLELWEAIPPGVWEDDPVAVLTAALLRPGAGQARSAYDLLFRPPLTDYDLPTGTRVVAEVIHAFLAPWSPDPIGNLAAAERALEALDQVDEATLPPVTGVRAAGPWRHLAQVGAARAEIVLGRWPAAARRLGELADDDTVGPLVRLNATASHARALALCGWLELAGDRAAAALAHAERRGVGQHPALVDAHLALAEVALWRHDLVGATVAAGEAEDRARRHRCPTQVAAAQSIRAGVALRRGHPERALQILVDVECPADGHPRHTIEAIRVRALHRSGATAAAQRLVMTLPIGPATILAHAEVGHVHDVDPLGGEPDQEPARGVLAPLALAIARHRVGADDAWVHLGAALEHAEPWGLIGPFAELPAALTITLGALPTHTPFAAAARAAAQREVPSATPGLQLTSTELTVLAALANPLPLREVADQLFVSTNTLKTHLRRIYRKLGVTSRSEAVAVARRLGLT